MGLGNNYEKQFWLTFCVFSGSTNDDYRQIIASMKEIVQILALSFLLFSCEKDKKIDAEQPSINYVSFAGFRSLSHHRLRYEST